MFAVCIVLSVRCLSRTGSKHRAVAGHLHVALICFVPPALVCLQCAGPSSVKSPPWLDLPPGADVNVCKPTLPLPPLCLHSLPHCLLQVPCVFLICRVWHALSACKQFVHWWTPLVVAWQACRLSFPHWYCPSVLTLQQRPSSTAAVSTALHLHLHCHWLNQVATWLFLPYVFQSPYLACYTWPRVPHVCASNFLVLFYTTCLLMFNTGRSNYSSSTAYRLSCVAVSLPCRCLTSLWLCIFNGAATRDALVLPHQQTPTGLSVVTVV